MRDSDGDLWFLCGFLLAIIVVIAIGLWSGPAY